MSKADYSMGVGGEVDGGLSCLDIATTQAK